MDPSCPLMTDLRHCAEASPHPHNWGSVLSCPAVDNRSSSPDFLWYKQKERDKDEVRLKFGEINAEMREMWHTHNFSSLPNRTRQFTAPLKHILLKQTEESCHLCPLTCGLSHCPILLFVQELDPPKAAVLDWLHHNKTAKHKLYFGRSRCSIWSPKSYHVVINLIVFLLLIWQGAPK